MPEHSSSILRTRAGRLVTIGAVAAIALTALAAVPASAATPTLELTLGQLTGTGPFDGDNVAGHDSSATNSTVRTNDTVAYSVGIRYEGENQSSPVITFTLPQGQELVSLPPFCLTGSSVTPAVLPAPANPVTTTSWTTLPLQTISCKVSDQSAGTSLNYDFFATVRPEMPQGASMGPMAASATTDQVTAPASSPAVSQVVSAAPRFDLSKRGEGTSNTTGAALGYYAACDFDTSRGCYFTIYSVTVNAPIGGKGITPLVSPLSFVDDLSPDALYGAGTTTSAAWLAAGAGAMDLYGPRLQGCFDANYNLRGSTPFSKPDGGAQTVDNSTRNSGTISCTNVNVAGASSELTITGADTSGYTVPTLSQSGQPLPATSNYVVSLSLAIQVPVDAIKDLGTSVNGTKALTFSNTYSDFTATDINGAPNAPEPLANNTRDVTASLVSDGLMGKYFTGVTGTAGNTSASEFNPGTGAWEGPPGAALVHDGNTVVMPGQTIISSLFSSQTFPAGTGNTFDRTRVMCDTWDSATLGMPVVWNQPVTTGTLLSNFASNGSPVYISGWTVSNVQQPDASALPNVKVQYGFLPVATQGVATGCNTGTWYDTAAAVPGATQVDGLWSGVNRTRISFSSFGTTSGGQFMVNAATALTVLPTAGPVGTVIPNYASTVIVDGQTTMADALATGVQSVSDYVPSTHAGGMGDRVTVGAVTARLKKYVRATSGGVFVSTGLPQYTSSNLVDYRLNPTLTADVSAGVTAPVVLEDCLPAFQLFASSVRESGAPISPTLVQLGSPPGAGVTCGANETYVRWDLGENVVNAVIDPVVYTVEISAVVRNGNYTNTAVISSAQDPSQVSLRTSTAQIQIVTPTGIKIEKSTPQSTVEVNPAGATNPRTLNWQVQFSNIDSPTGVANADVIDVLPANGLGATAYTGGLSFTSATPTSATTGVVILYTKNSPSDLAVDPVNASNGSSGSTIWCDAVSGGAVASGAGAASDCPASAAEVTGLRFVRSGALLPTDEFGVNVVMTPVRNADGDIYDNSTAGRIDGVSQPVGPKNRQISIVGGSISNFVWNDTNSNGLQDVGESPVAGMPVTISGTDENGNTVTGSTTTDAAGNYLFSNLPSGSYVVTFDRAWSSARGFDFTQESVGTDATIDSDANPATGATEPIALAISEDRTDIDAGVVRQLTASISIVKVIIDPDTSDTLGDAPSFPVTVTCTVPESATPIVRETTILADGTPQTVSGLPVGALCTVVETDTDGGTATYSVTNGALTTVNGDTAVVVTNTYPVTSVPPVPNTPTSVVSQLAATGVDASLPIVAGGLLGLLGAAMIMLAAGRRRAAE